MNKESFCSWIKEIREKKITRTGMASKYPWHENTIKAYEKDRLPDVDYLFVLSTETQYPFLDLIRKRLEAGLLELDIYMMQDYWEMLDLIEKGSKSWIPDTSIQSDEKNAEDRTCSDIAINGLNSNNLVDIIVDDDAMEPTIQKGAMCGIDFHDTQLSPGAVYGFSVGRPESSSKISIIRRVQSSLKGTIILVTDNPTYPAQELSEELKKEITVIGRIKSVTNTL